MNPILSNRQESFSGSRFAREYSWSGLWGWVENVVSSSRFDRIDWSLWPRFKNEEGSCIFISQILTSGGLCRACGLKMLSIRVDTNRFPFCRFVIPEVDLRDATPCESSRDVTCESSRIVKCLRRIDSVWVYWTWRVLGVIPAKYKITFKLKKTWKW